MQTARRPGRPRSESAERAILTAAQELFAEHGMAGLRMEAVAERAGVGKTTVYRRWSNKNDLLIDAVADLRGPLPAPPGDSVRDDLRFLLGHVRKQAGNTLHGRIMAKLSGDKASNPELDELFHARIVTPRREITANVIRRGIERGEIEPGVDVELVVNLLTAPVFYCVVMRDESLSDEQLDFIVDTVLRGCAP